MGACGSIVHKGISVFFEYDTPRIVHIRSKKVGVINRLIQLAIICYVGIYAIWYKKGYQEFDNVVSGVTTKVKGVVYVNQTEYPNITTSVWDVAEYVIPPQESNAFFVITNLIETPGQSIGICPEDPSKTGAVCKKDSDCKEGDILPTGNGILTGKCGPEGICLIRAWCPVESGTEPSKPPLMGSKDFTVFIKNNIQFPKFGVKRRNLPDNGSDAFFKSCTYSQSKDCPIFRLETITREAGVSQYADIAKEVEQRRNILSFYNNSQLSTCRYNQSDSVNKFCPIFKLEDITKMAGSNYTDLAVLGGVIEIQINWDCNLDLSISKCVPKYKFRRLDSDDYKISKGYNFRYARYYRENGTEYRNLIKAYGVRYLVSVTGQGGKFSAEPFFINIGSGLALLGVATILCDIVVLYILKGKQLYYQKKYLQVVGEDAYQQLTESSVNENEESSKSK